MIITLNIDNKHAVRLGKAFNLPEGSTLADVKTAVSDYCTTSLRNFVRGEVVKEEAAKVNPIVLVPDSEIAAS